MRALAPVFLALVLLGCAARSPSSTPEIQARPVTCRAGTDCEAKWSRALSWVATNSTWKVQTQTDILIQTYNSTESSPKPSFTVTRVAQPGGGYLIEFTGGCANFLGCVPTIPEARVQFADYVMAIDGAAAAPASTQSR